MVQVLDLTYDSFVKYFINYNKKYILFDSKGNIISYDGYNVNKNDNDFDNFDSFGTSNYDEYNDYEQYSNFSNDNEKPKNELLELNLYELYICIIDDIPYQIYAERINNKAYILMEEITNITYYEELYDLEIADSLDKENTLLNFYNCYVIDIYNFEINEIEDFLKTYKLRLRNEVYYDEPARDMYLIKKGLGELYYIGENIEIYNNGIDAQVEIRSFYRLNKKDYTTDELIELSKKNEKGKSLELHK